MNPAPPQRPRPPAPPTPRHPSGGLLRRLAGGAARAAFLAAATPAVVRAALRVSRQLRRSEMRALPGRLRRVEPFAVPGLARPAWLDGAAARLLPFLPPRGVGRCLKRSLILLDLWSRCGLEPVLHVGVRRPGGVVRQDGAVGADRVPGAAKADDGGGEREAPERETRENPLEAHAWVTVGDPALDRRTGPDGWEELWSG